MKIEALMKALYPGRVVKYSDGSKGEVWGSSLQVWVDDKHDGGGYKVAFGSSIAYGDTLEDAIQAVHDHVLQRKSKHRRLQPPFFSDTPRTMENRRPCNYDYRKKDWTPADDPAPVRGKSTSEVEAYLESRKKGSKP